MIGEQLGPVRVLERGFGRGYGKEDRAGRESVGTPGRMRKCVSASAYGLVDGFADVAEGGQRRLDQRQVVRAPHVLQQLRHELAPVTVGKVDGGDRGHGLPTPEHHDRAAPGVIRTTCVHEHMRARTGLARRRKRSSKKEAHTRAAIRPTCPCLEASVRSVWVVLDVGVWGRMAGSVSVGEGPLRGPARMRNAHQEADGALDRGVQRDPLLVDLQLVLGILSNAKRDPREGRRAGRRAGGRAGRRAGSAMVRASCT